jgi:AcrR family transcriptional regulator
MSREDRHLHAIDGTHAVGGSRTPRTRPMYDPDSLLEVAVAVFNTRGYDATSMEDLSKAAGITKSSFYHHVSGKEELLRRGLERALNSLFVILEEPGVTEGSPLDRLRYTLRRQVEVLTSELPYVTLLLRARGNTDTERWALTRRRAFDASVAALVAEAVAEGQVRPGLEPALTARLLSGTVNSIIEWYQVRHRRLERLPDDVVRVICEGILPPGSQPTTPPGDNIRGFGP